ncbi:HlyD family efflux transporter periplasmic adaptor subunit [Ancylomarina euxinus]|uniref:HlyD family efflux transporter periplasmic adaptor subunit n=1 Tax=Ancylomarina euxinus TaxID=2283627 RepID=A0A425XYI3_9BACT|nr:HlyD family efflux transporter periplasmic adaptor subunit [Ancylomarina euxinus]MCZ4695736.1 HlyD family efflux transporter periplasmic adaptor subunit [Ancylomarina euxinus]MUP16189.1 HlyD family efflux transporter periplasmic adaptor subunit [Ancylomarina euxinus]RRG20050.1 HlyD family efflux transporter periplasmic adaptor subunit [Ancylomarina euxinus]
MNRKVVIVVSVALILTLAYAGMVGLKSLKKQPQKDINRKKVPFVKVEQVNYQAIATPIVEKGRLLSNLEVNLSSEVPGRIVEVGVPLKVGQRFKKGDLLIQIYDTDARMDLQAKKSQFLNKLAQCLPDIRIDYTDRFDAWMDFFNAIDLEKALPELPEITTGKEKVFLASRNILGDYYAIKSSEVKLSKYRIYAPFTGSYVQVSTQKGAVAGMGAKLAGLIESSKLELQVPVESEDIKWLRIGDQVDVLTSDGEKIAYGKLIRKSEFVDEGTQSIAVFVGLKTNNSELYQGQYLTAKFNGKLIDQVMEIPRNAVFRSNRVFVVEENMLKEKQINVLKRNENTLIFNGLTKGELLVTTVPVKAAENMKVQILK